jgi:16S rRNA processing protein RimM
MEPTAASRSSTDGAPPDAVVVGRVIGAHGLRGGLRVRGAGGDPDPLLALPHVFLARSASGAEARRFEVRKVAPGRSGELRVDLEGLAGRDAAEAWSGAFVLAAASALPPLPAGEYYGHQLLGCRVEGEDGRSVGTVCEIWETGASDLLVVDDGAGARHLLPAALLRRVDAAERRIVMELVPGLLPDG